MQHIDTLERNQSISSTSMASTSGNHNQVHTGPLDSHSSAGDGALVECKVSPVGFLQVIFSTNFYIVLNRLVCAVDEEMCLKAKIAHEDYEKEVYC